MFHLTTALDPGSQVPLYEQLYRSLMAELRAGAVPAGTRMPGKRSLAAELSVSINTVDTAYQMLTAEGYLESRPRSGFYVQPNLCQPPLPEPVPTQPALAAPAPPVQLDLSTRGVDTGLFPARTWARLQKELLYSSPQLLAPGDAQGDPELRQALAEYLAQYRGVRCGAHQIVVGAGLEYLLGLLAPLLPGPAAVETPGYPRAKQVLENNGVSCCCLPVDREGMSVQALEDSGAAVCYVTPSHQFPTGVTMPAPRRTELLHWAARGQGRRLIIEDDYDSEFRFDTRPLPSLQGMAGVDGPVVYLSTCSRSLAPGIRIAYMVLPEHLLPAWQRATPSMRARWAALSSRRWPALSQADILPGIWPGSGWHIKPGGMVWCRGWTGRSARGRSPWKGCIPGCICCCACGTRRRTTSCAAWRPGRGCGWRCSVIIVWTAAPRAAKGRWCWVMAPYRMRIVRRPG